MPELVKVHITCCLCNAAHDTEIALPADWRTRYDEIDNTDGFCPKHAKIADFAEAQCSGCVGGWGDCSLWKAFAYRKFELTENDFAQMRKGVCPKRTNGTFSVSRSEGVENINLSEQADNESGAALEAAIKEYHARYNTEQK
jgi:hypothetical protein